ncbi:MAG: thioredoxin [Ruminococcus sp.]|nr:thioredoxin [Ruminococcus sp.]MDO4418782.1 thioredoxin [Ruminococcus sp.]
MALVHITKENFNKEVMESEKVVLLDFWATWCGPCQMIAPILNEVAEECPDITVGKIDVDEEQELAMSFGITSIPTLIVIKNGKAVDKAIGMRAKNQIIEMIDNA